MNVKLEPGMTAIRRDRVRVGPVPKSDGHEKYPFDVGDQSYTPSGKFWSNGQQSQCDLIAAGFPWTELGAQAGDTVRCVWDGSHASGYEHIFGSAEWSGNEASLYVIVAHAAKPADRPRAAHKMDLRDGDVVELVAWQGGDERSKDLFGRRYTFRCGTLWDEHNCAMFAVPSALPKGHRPLFRVVSRADDSYDLSDMPEFRAADATPDEVVVLYGFNPDCIGWSAERVNGDAQRLTLTFPAGSDTGTVEREEL